MTIDTADTVLHRPSGERWLVAVARTEQDEIIPCGWPLSFARLSDCDLVRAATDEQREALLNQMADMQDGSDPRCRHARWRLGIRQPEHPSAEQS